MMSPVISLLALIVTLGVLITVHEFGHFWVARRLGVKVLRFSVGFGHPLWRRSGQDGVEYVIAAIPFGGYVRMLDEREGEVAPGEVHRAFNRQSVWTRIAIVAAGPIFNFAFAIGAYTLMFMIGVTGVRPLLGEPAPGSLAAAAGFQEGDLIVAVAEQPVRTLDEVMLALIDARLAGPDVQVQVQDQDQRFRYRIIDLQTLPGEAEDTGVLEQIGLSLWQPRLPAVIAAIMPGGAAERAGLQSGDRILMADGRPVGDWQEWAGYVRERPGERLTVQVDRGGQPLSLEIVPDAVRTGEGVLGRIGASAQVPEAIAESLRIMLRYSPPRAFLEAVRKTWSMSVFTVRMLGRILIGKASLENISGPIAIAQFAGQSASIGAIAFLSFLALVSISLGVLNLLPVPVLDGGHLMYYFIEVVKGSPLSESLQQAGQRIGLVLLLILMGLALANDLARLLEQ